MSKNLTRTGVAFGTAVAFGVAGLTGISPAAAVPGASDAFDLSPSNGDTYNSITYSGVQVNSVIDSSFAYDMLAGEDYDYTGDHMKYQIKSTDGTDLAQLIEDSALEISLGEYDSNLDEDNWSDWDWQSYDDGETIVIDVYDTAYFRNDVGGYDNPNYLQLWFDEKVSGDFQFEVTPWLDLDDDWGIDTQEPTTSNEATVNLYSPSSVKAVATVDPEAEVGDNDLYTTATFNHDINPNQVLNDFISEDGEDLDTWFKFFQSGNSTVSENGAWVNSDDVLESYYSYNDVTARNYNTQLYYYYNVWDEDNNVYTDKSVALSAKSATLSLLPGNNSDVSYIYDATTSTKDLVVDYNNYDYDDWGMDYIDMLARTGDATSSKLTAQIARDDAKANDEPLTDGEDYYMDDLKAANVKVKAIFWPITDLARGSTISVAGATGTLDKDSYNDSETIVAYGKTDANGQVSFTVNGVKAQDGQRLAVEYYYLDTDGYWVQDDESSNPESDQDYDVSLEWQDTVVADFSVTPDSPVAGDSISLTYEAVDQFGTKVDELDGDALHLYVVAEVDGENDATAMKKDVDLTGGSYTATFNNFVAKGDFGRVNAYLTVDGEDKDETSSAVDANLDGDNWLSTDIYHNNATAEIIVDQAIYETEITYGAFPATKNFGNASDSDTNWEDAYDTAELTSNYETITGTLSDASGAHQAYEQVTISGKGLLFSVYSDDVNGYAFAQDSIKLVTNENGEYSVDVYAHKVVNAGQNITVTSGSKTATTVLKTFLTSDITDDEVKVSWNAPAHPSAKRSYLVTATVTDIWGNPLKGAVVYIDDSDFVAVAPVSANSDGDSEADKNGQVSFLVRAFNWNYKVGDVLPYYLDLVVDDLNVDLNGDGNVNNSVDDSTYWEFSTALDTHKYKNGFFGTQASAKAGKKAGRANVSIYNAAGKTAKVFVDGKLAKTVSVAKASSKIALTGLAKGSKRIKVSVAGTVIFIGDVVVK